MVKINRMSMNVLGMLVLFVGLFCTSQTNAYDGTFPKIFDWVVGPNWYNGSSSIDREGFDSANPEITPTAFASQSAYWNNWAVNRMYKTLLDSNRPVGLSLRPPGDPIGGSLDPLTLAKTMNFLSSRTNGRFNYLFMDFEPNYTPGVIASTTEAVRQVRAHADSRINQAFCGNYNDFVCTSVLWDPSPAAGLATTISNAYTDAGLNVAMPSLYPYSYYMLHASETKFTPPFRSPNQRSALFWAPLEKLSQAKKALPTGHELIPWINNYVDSGPGYVTTAPTREDNTASLLHYRLRGVDGYHGFVTMSDGVSPAYTSEEYRADMLDAWKSLDWLFDSAAAVDILNLETDKSGGFEWSAVETENGVAAILSNLGISGTNFYFQTLVDAGMDPAYVNLLNGGQNYVYVDSGEHWLCSSDDVPVELMTVPEPATMSVLLLGAVSVLYRRRRKLCVR